MTVLPNGNVVVTDPKGPVSNVGAVHLYTPGGTKVSTITGGTAEDHVGSGGVIALQGGNYVIASPEWDGADFGALTLGAGGAATGTVVSAGNSLTGATASDAVGSGGVTANADGTFTALTINWDNLALPGAQSLDDGAVTLVVGSGTLPGTITAANSVLGTSPGNGSTMSFAYDATHKRLFVGRPASNVVTILTLVDDEIFWNGFQ